MKNKEIIVRELTRVLTLLQNKQNNAKNSNVEPTTYLCCALFLKGRMVASNKTDEQIAREWFDTQRPSDDQHQEHYVRQRTYSVWFDNDLQRIAFLKYLLNLLRYE